jgi:acid phosphatase family membrane protein YuiD
VTRLKFETTGMPAGHSTLRTSYTVEEYQSQE